MKTEERCEADEDPDGKTGGNMPGMVIQGEDMLYPIFPFFLVEQSITSDLLRPYSKIQPPVCQFISHFIRVKTFFRITVSRKKLPAIAKLA
jgi:hypothetical protein